MRRARLALLLSLAACDAGQAPPPARVWTLLDLQAAAARGENVLAGAIGLAPSGLPAAGFVAGDRLPARFVISEGAPGAYVSTDLWSQFPAVWVQPIYVLVTGRAPDGSWQRLGGRDLVFGVGPRSRFWSPFWQVFYVEVPPGSDPAAYRTPKRILDAGRPVHRGGARLATFVPASIPGQALDLAAQPAAALLDGNIGQPLRTIGWADGEEIDVLDFGRDRFTWNERLEVDEAPLFLPVARDASGALALLGLPPIGGTGPLFSARPPLPGRGAPAFGSLWRLYGLRLPPGAGVVVPLADQQTRIALAGKGLKVEDGPPGREYQIALDGSCLPAGDGCTWLSSQAEVERHLPGAFLRTEALVACPFIAYQGKPVRTGEAW